MQSFGENDIVFIKSLEVHTIIGIYDWEQATKQKLLIDIEASHDNTVPAGTDNIEDAVDYEFISTSIVKLFQNTKYQLIETVAEVCANWILTNTKSKTVKITVSKPGAISDAMNVGVQIARSKTNIN